MPNIGGSGVHYRGCGPYHFCCSPGWIFHDPVCDLPCEDAVRAGEYIVICTARQRYGVGGGAVSSACLIAYCWCTSAPYTHSLVTVLRPGLASLYICPSYISSLKRSKPLLHVCSYPLIRVCPYTLGRAPRRARGVATQWFRARGRNVIVPRVAWLVVNRRGGMGCEQKKGTLEMDFACWQANLKPQTSSGL